MGTNLQVQTSPRLGTQGLENAVSRRAGRPLHEDLAARGADPALRELIAGLVPAALSRAPVILRGESGVGKEYFARRIHRLRWDTEDGFVAVCASAMRTVRLRAILSGRVRLGQARALTVYIRGLELLTPSAHCTLSDWMARTGAGPVGPPLVIGATHATLEGPVRGILVDPAFPPGARARVLTVPAVRNRGDDRLVLVSDILLGLSEELGKPVPTLSAQAWRRIWESPWRGNVRELVNCLRQAMLLAEPRRPLTI